MAGKPYTGFGRLGEYTMYDTTPFIQKVNTPAYVMDEQLLIHNLQILKQVREKTGAKILLAQKAFSMFSVYPLLSEYLDGTTASGLYEAKLGKEEMGNREVHVYAPAFKQQDMEQLVTFCDHIVFNSPAQWQKYKELVKNSNRNISCGLRINPEYAEVDTDLYNPCIAGSRLGTTLEQLEHVNLEGISGLHFHTMCEQDADVLWRTVQIVDTKFEHILKKMKWINFGGGHHITRESYQMDLLEKSIRLFQDKYGLQVYLEPGEAIALNAGFLVSEVMEIMENQKKIAILDTSAACHMPDVLEMPYSPNILQGEHLCKPYQKEPDKIPYLLGGPTCLAGDVIGEYGFFKHLKEGDRIVFCDMAIYTMVKNNTFNGMPLPSIYLYTKDNTLKKIREFSYSDFKMRLS